MRRINPFWLVLAVAFGLLAASCASDPSELVVGSDDQEADSASEDGDSAVADVSAPVAIVPTTTTDPAFTTTTQPAVTTTLVAPPTTDFRSGFEVREPLGLAGVGIGEWVVYRPLGSDDNECPPGILAFEVDGEMLHGYVESSFNGGIRLFSGTRGQDAFVINCEESVERVLMQTSALLPDRGYPYFDELDLFDEFGAEDARFEFLADWGWRGDVFAGYGMMRDQYDLWAFGIPDAGVISMDSLFGQRLPIDADMGFSLIVPRAWTHGSTVDGELTKSQTSASRTQAWTVDGIAVTPLAEGDKLLSSDTSTVKIWLDGVPAEFVSTVEATDWTFLSDEGVRVVRHIPRESDTVVVEMFADSADSSIDQDLPWLVLELLRVFQTT